MDTQGPVTIVVADMSSRADVRAVSASIRDLPGVTAVRVDPAARRIRVHGDATLREVIGAVARAGHHADAPG